ncbi:hypothetical protein [Nocardia higoensis]|uniref:hypothetical protein n=1 Tax=Nocardia higoensis TaxID=228599 RepID=UPI000319329C|nr:hypothetical protein [Nocardia higoensis]
MAADTPPPSICAVVPLEQAPSIRTTADERRHDNPHWPTRSPRDATSALLLHGECPWHCSTKVAAIIVTRNDYQYFRDRGRIEGNTWTPSLSGC